IRWENNITYDAYSWVGGVPHGHDKARTGSWDGPATAVIFDYNVIAHGSRRLQASGKFGTTEFSAFGVQWADGDAMSRSTIYIHNTSKAPRFVDEVNHDYRLADDDHVARDTGVDLSFLGLPGLDTDLYGHRRGFGRGWDRGALEWVDGGSARN